MQMGLSDLCKMPLNVKNESDLERNKNSILAVSKSKHMSAIFNHFIFCRIKGGSTCPVE